MMIWAFCGGFVRAAGFFFSRLRAPDKNNMENMMEAIKI